MSQNTNLTVSDDVRIQLLHEARHAAKNAHAPFSNFHVGSAVMMEDGNIYTGCNVENSSYGLANCAERVAIQGAVAKGMRKIKYIAVTCIDALSAPICDRSPCGACRQVIKEFSTDGTIIIVDDGNKGVLFSIEDILPHGFRF